MSPMICSECGKPTVNDLCIRCNEKLRYRRQMYIKCTICGKGTTTTRPRKNFKCMKCR